MTTQTELVRGKVARVLSTREVALNVGKEQGVQPDMIFDILSVKGADIRDPDTHEVLGTVDVRKARVKVNQVYDKVSVATTFRTRRVNVGGQGVGFSQLFQPPKWEDRVETLKTKGGFESSSEALDEEDSYVATGDPVVQVIEVEV